MTDSPIDFDWVNLDPSISPISLWDSLHDANLVSIESDPLRRIVIITVDVFYIREFHQLPDDLCFLLTLDGVTSVRSVSFRPWPGEFNLPDGLSRQEEDTLVNEYHKKWREESMSWSETETLLSSENFVILDADLAQGKGGVTIKIGGTIEDEPKYVSLHIRAANLIISRSDGIPCSLEQFLSLGEKYWEDFSQRASH